jgi:ketopantoate hydroxymethyltransferase
MLSIYSGNHPNYKPLRFVRNFMQAAASVRHAVEPYVQAIKNKEFPALEYGF